MTSEMGRWKTTIVRCRGMRRDVCTFGYNGVPTESHITGEWPEHIPDATHLALLNSEWMYHGKGTMDEAHERAVQKARKLLGLKNISDLLELS